MLSRAPAGTEAPAGGEASNIQKSGECGMGTGEPATGEPIKLSAMATKAPVADFTWITGLTRAYFDCVNDNGGINGPFAIRQGMWKLVGGGAVNAKKAQGNGAQLFNLADDLGETKNLADKNPEKVKELTELLRQIRAK